MRMLQIFSVFCDFKKATFLNVLLPIRNCIEYIETNLNIRYLHRDRVTNLLFSNFLRVRKVTKVKTAVSKHFYIILLRFV